MDLIRSLFKKVNFSLKDQREKAAMTYKGIGDIPSSFTDSKSLFQSVKDEIWKEISTKTLDDPIYSLHSDAKMRPSAE